MGVNWQFTLFNRLKQILDSAIARKEIKHLEVAWVEQSET